MNRAAVVVSLAAAVLGAGVAVAATARAAQPPRAAAIAESGSQYSRGASGADPAPHSVVLIGLSGLRWTDVSASATPAIWRLAVRGSVGSLVDTTIGKLTCPADAWLTLNSGARSAVSRPPSGPCPGLPAVERAPAAAPGQPGGSAQPASIPDMAGLERGNTAYSPYRWGLLGGAAGRQCATAVGPGAALALASASGGIPRYLALPSAAGPAALSRCPLTAVDLGALPAPGPGADGTARAAAVRAADHAVAAITALARPGSILLLAGLGDTASQHLRVIIVDGGGYGPGLLTSKSTRQPGIAAITDLIPSVLSWRGQLVPAQLPGSPLETSARGQLAAQIGSMIGQDTAEQVYRQSLGWVLLGYGVAEAVLFALIALILRGGQPERIRARVSAYTAAAVVAAAVPAGTFLVNLVPWAQLPHPALLLWGLGLAWAAAIAAVALAGPWRHDPFGPPGFVAAVTLGVIAIDVITGSRLQLGAPFGLSLLEAGRFYGLGNNALGVYGTAGMLAAAWAAVAAGRSGSRGRALAACGAVALIAVIACGWPGFGAKVGGTIALVPAFLLLLAALAGARITARRALILAASGLLLAAAFAAVNYLVPATGLSHEGGFVAQLLHGHGSAAATLRRKISSNLQSITETWFTPVIPVVAAGTLAMLAWPGRLRLGTLIRAQQAEQMLRPLLVATWLAAVLGWFADDSGVSVAAAALPVALPLAIALVARIAAGQRPAVTATSESGPLARRSGHARSGTAADPAG